MMAYKGRLGATRSQWIVDTQWTLYRSDYSGVISLNMLFEHAPRSVETHCRRCTNN
jgi:hypothetical protein